MTAAVVLSRYLPAQNIAFIIVFLASAEAALELWKEAGNWAQGALFWPGAIILLRASGEIFMKPWRQARNYGVILLGLISGCAAFIQLVFSSLEAGVLRFCVTAGCLLFLTPWFIQKRVKASAAPKK
jgi:hypothetical protein